MNPIYFLLAAVILGLAQVWTKPNFRHFHSTSGIGYDQVKWRWNWTFCILWVALAALVLYSVYPMLYSLL